IDFVVDGASRMKALINDLLAYSRVQRVSGEVALFNGQRALDRALNNLQLTIEDNQAVITSDPIPKLLANEALMVQLFQNLIGNALKFRREVPPEIHIGVEEEQDAWLFSVRDNGIGIKAEYLDRIFVIFQRLHARGKYPGTGIGLAICKKVVENHGGRIRVESVPGEGTTFYFTIPISQNRRINANAADRNIAG
ncbi:MAG TPA: ATP-binding protein, partial [Phototrophicaceae bacterium]|nr:ATP-binding protein [Phototrophicaceae bacterium]